MIRIRVFWNVTLCDTVSVSRLLNWRSLFFSGRRRMIPTSDSCLVLLSVAQSADDRFAFTGVLLSYLYWLVKFLWRFNDKFWQYSFIFLQIIVTLIHYYPLTVLSNDRSIQYANHISVFCKKVGLWYSFMGSNSSAVFIAVSFENDLIYCQLCLDLLITFIILAHRLWCDHLTIDTNPANSENLSHCLCVCLH